MAHSLDNKERTKDVLLGKNEKFENLFLSDNVFKGLDENGFKTPSPIQLKAIPVGRCGFDLIVKSKSGTGKTVVFSVIALETVDPKKNDVQVLILTPTREIAVQVQEVISKLGQFITGLKVQSFIGGTSLEEDIQKCENCHIAVGAPGRLRHLIQDKHLRTDSIRLLVLDEADKLMEGCFESDINEIYNTLPTKKQMITTSATYPNELDTFLSKYMLSPTHISVEVDSPLLLGLKHFVKRIEPCSAVAVQMKLKNDILINLLSRVSFTQCLIYSNYQTRTESVCNFLNQKNFNATFISAAQNQTQRLKAITDLKEFKCRILLSTDLTARGIDAENVDLIINYDVPFDAVTYLHRMGRAGRFGSSGVCISLVFEDEIPQIQKILYNIGGTTLAMPVFPNLDENQIDLLKADTSNYEKIYGEVQDDSNSPHLGIQKEVFEIIHSKQIHNKTDLKKKTKQKPKKDATLRLNGHNDENKQLLLDIMLEDPSKKRKRAEPESCESVTQKSKSPNNSDEGILIKNKAKLSITKLLTQDICNPTQEDIDAISTYLDSIHRGHNNGDDYVKPKENSNGEVVQNAELTGDSGIPKLEDIFKYCYQNTLNPSSKHWLRNYKRSILKQKASLKEESSYEENNDQQEYSACTDDDSFMKWVPVQHSKQQSSSTILFERTNETEKNIPQPSSSGFNGNGGTNVSQMYYNLPFDYEKIYQYYNECNTELWENGLTFSTVEEFNNWYDGEWLVKLGNVRKFIEESLYVQYMSEYQTRKFPRN